MAYTYDPTTVYIDPTGEEKPMETVDASIIETEEMKQALGVETWMHIHPLTAQIDINQVADQLSNDPQRPEMTVTVNDLKKGGPIDYAFGYKRPDERD